MISICRIPLPFLRLPHLHRGVRLALISPSIRQAISIRQLARAEVTALGRERIEEDPKGHIHGVGQATEETTQVDNTEVAGIEMLEIIGADTPLEFQINMGKVMGRQTAMARLGPIAMQPRTLRQEVAPLTTIVCNKEDRTTMLIRAHTDPHLAMARYRMPLAHRHHSAEPNPQGSGHFRQLSTKPQAHDLKQLQLCRASTLVSQRVCL